ncbi:MAG: Kdo hydroxylase family protein [Gammaproteobacteria bacterium]|nr:Kdo hydroxylase family protein [Gammaproteobacteria bacterium]MDH3536533.1 Kdo hydroxylase family protein [Gammaproteobacteria bacterium]
MLDTYDENRLQQLQPDEISDSLERGSIVYFPKSPVALPDPQDLSFFRQELPNLVKLKNISFHPEAGRVRGLDSDDTALTERVSRILESVSNNIARFLSTTAPRLTENWTVGTCSFRPIQERGRNLSAHASNELVHIDAGAYGATHGDRILRFFINVNPDEDRVWVTKGNFPELLQAHGERAGLGYDKASRDYLARGPLDHAWSGFVNGLSRAVPVAKVLDSSPYDREMRRFHNYMKDTPSFQQDMHGHEEFRFPPFSAWMVFTDTVSHACLSGQYAFVHTSIVRLANLRLPELAPINLLRQAAQSG